MTAALRKLLLRGAFLALVPLAAEEPPASPILAPPPLSAHPASSPVRFIGSGKPAGASVLKLDGKEVALASPHDGVYTAELPAQSGEHEIEFEGQKLKFAVGPAAPAGYTAFRPHPPASQCSTCHAVRNGRWRFQRVSLASVCSQCHAKESFPAKHTHEMAVLTDCQLCHNPHGSTVAAPAHLKLKREAACKQCHALQ